MDTDAASALNPPADLKNNLASPAAARHRLFAALRVIRYRWGYALEWALIIAVAYFYTAEVLLDFNSTQLQQTGEQNENVTRPFLIETSLKLHGAIPLWNPYLATGLPFAGDPLNHFWNPVATVPILIWGAINGMKVSAFLSFALAGIGQWAFAHVLGVRGLPRLWAGLLFMVSGGLAFLWRAGWSELLVGMAWFPWCFAALWWALPRRDTTSLALTALCVAMVVTANAGDLSFYLLGSLSLMALMAALWVKAKNRWIHLGRAAIVAALSAGLAGVVLVPLFSSYPYLVWRAKPDLAQPYSQSIPYALANYVISKPDWFSTTILGGVEKSNWLYIGWLPLAVLLLLPAILSQARWHRPALISFGILTLLLLAWEANRFTPVKYLYDWLPFLYNLRFPNHLLIVIASPLIVMASLILQYGIVGLRRRGGGLVILLTWQGTGKTVARISARHFVNIGLALGIFLCTWDVYTVNKDFNFARGAPELKATFILTWLKNYDPGLYYVAIGGDLLFPNWLPAAYRLEMPAINFDDGRSIAVQRKALAPLAKPKYLITLPNLLIQKNVELLKEVDGFQVWRATDALPFAFGVQPPVLVNPAQPPTPDQVVPLAARLDGPNRLVVEARAEDTSQRLVVLVSDFPGWQVSIDGHPAGLAWAEPYLGVDMLAGLHTYTFVFQPIAFQIGAALSLLTLGLMAALVGFEARRGWRQSKTVIRS